MKTKHMSALLRDDITTVSVYFQHNVINRENATDVNRYTFKVLKADAVSLKDGSMVVVETKNGLAVAQVFEVHAEPMIDPDFEGDYKWVVDIIDYDRYMVVVEHEREMDAAMLEAEREIKRKSIVEQYREALGKTPLGKKLGALLTGPALPAPAAAPVAKKSVKR